MSYVDSTLLSDERVAYRARLHWTIFISVAGFLTLFIAPLIRRKTSEFAVTNRRVIIKTGFVSRHTLELNLVKVESVGVEQSLMGRIFGFGTITVIGTGGTRESFQRLADPLGFRRAVQVAIDQKNDMGLSITDGIVRRTNDSR